MAAVTAVAAAADTLQEDSAPLRLQLACGMAHTLVCTDSGDTWAFGAGRMGQLGIGEQADRLDPVRVKHGNGKDALDSLRNQRVIQVSCGAFHSCAVTASGLLFTWGLEDKGRLGHTDTSGIAENKETARNLRNPDVPCLVRGFPEGVKIKQVAAGADHTVCVDMEGQVYTWGLGNFGNLGHGDTADSMQPRLVAGLAGKNVKMVAAGAKHTLALTAKGEVYSWGHGDNGRLGHGGSRGRLVPEVIESLRGHHVTFIVAGEAHSAAVTVSGGVYTWGAGTYGRLGHGDELDVDVPQLVDSLQRLTVKMVGCGAFHTVALTATGEMYAFGGGQYGKLGHGDMRNRPTPMAIIANVQGLRITQVACGSFHTVAVAQDGVMLTWGCGGNGRLGLGDETNQSLPCVVQQMRARGVTGTAGDPAGTGAHNAMSAVAAGASESVAQLDARSKTIRMVAAGAQHCIAVTYGGTVWAWGEAEMGQLGMSSAEDAYEPREVRGALFGKKVVAVACGAQHSLALTSFGETFAWGRGVEGQLGSGHRRNEDRAVQVQGLAGRVVVSIAAGEDYSAAVLDNGALYTWGAGDSGKLGHGRGSRYQLLPRMVAGELLAHKVQQVSLGMSHSACVTERGLVFSWGGGWFGRLGHGDTDNVYQPRQIQGLRYRQIKQVACGGYHSAAVTVEGDLYVWGRGDQRLGLGDTPSMHEPTLVAWLRQQQVNVLAVAAGEEHTLVVAHSGEVWAWGKGRHGKLGRGDAEDVEAPAQVLTAPDQPLRLGLFDSADKLAGEEDTRTAVALANHCIALDRRGAVYTWGCGGSGRLGNGGTQPLLFATHLQHRALPLADLRGARDAMAVGVTTSAARAEDADEGEAEGKWEDDGGSDSRTATRRAEATAAEDLLIEFKTHDASRAPPLNLVQRLLQAEPAAYRENQLRQSVEALVRTRDEALGLVAECTALEREIGDIRGRIGITLQSTLRKAAPNPYPPLQKRITLQQLDRDVRNALQSVTAAQPVFERIFSLLLAHPAYLTRIFREYVLHGNEEEEPVLCSQEHYVEFVKAVYGDLHNPRSERLFLTLLRQLLREEAERPGVHTLGSFLLEFGRPDSVIGLLVQDYFQREENMAVLRNLFSDTLADFLKEQDAAGAPLDMNFDPVAVHNSLQADPRACIDDVSASDRVRAELYEQPRVKAEVAQRVARLTQVSLDWFGKVARSVQGLPQGMRWLCRQVFLIVSERFGVGDEDPENIQLVIGKFLIDRYFRPAIQFPKRFGLLPRAAALTAVQSTNLRLLCDVIRHIAGGVDYMAEQKWLLAVNNSIRQQRREAIGMVRTLVSVPDALQQELVMDSIREFLRADPLVHTVYLNQLLYLQAIVARDITNITVKEPDPLESLVHKLFPSAYHRDQASNFVMLPRQFNFGINLTLDTRFEKLPCATPKACVETGVPLPAFMATPDAPDLLLEDRFKLTSLDTGSAAVQALLREAHDVGPSATVDSLKLQFAAALDALMDDGNLEQAVQVQVALHRLSEIEVHPEALGHMLVHFLQGLEERAAKARELEQEHFAMEGLKTDILSFRQSLIARRASMRQYLQVLQEGVQFTQNRAAIRDTARRSDAALTPGHLVKASHKSGSLVETKSQLAEQAHAVGSFARFKYRVLQQKGAVLRFTLNKDTARKVDPERLTRKIEYLITMKDAGVFEVETIYDKDVIVDTVEFSMDELQRRERSMEHEFVPADETSRSKTVFSVPALIYVLNTELRMRRLVLK